MVFVAGIQAQQSQTARQAPVFRSGTTLVQLDVVVTDKDGKPVTGLEKSDFTILDGGRERPVVAMNEFHHEAPKNAILSSDVATGATERLVAVVLDDHSQTGEPLERAKDVAREIIRALAGRAQLALVRTSREPGVEFTSDAQALLDALNLTPTIEAQLVRPTMAWGTLWALLHKGDIYVENDIALEPKTRLEPERTPGRVPPSNPVMKIPDTLYNALPDGVLSANDGRRKSFIVISEGEFYSRLRGPFIEDEVKRFEAGKLNDAQIIGDVHERLQAVWRAASRTNSAVSIVDPRIATAGRRVSEAGRAKLQRAALDAIARLSGGHTAIRDETLPSAIDRMLSELDHYYVLGFEPVVAKNPSARNVNVRVNRPDLLVQHRTSYRLDETARLRAVAAYKKDPLLGLAYSPIPTSDLPLRVWASVLHPASASEPAPIALWLDSGAAILQEYAVFVLDMDKHKEVGKPVGRKLTGIAPSPLPLDAPALRPGRYQLRVAARDETVGGSAYLTVTVPEFANSTLAVTGLVLSQSFSTRPDIGALPFAPTLNRVFGPGSTLRVGFKVWAAAETGDVETSIEVLDANGRTVDRVTKAIDIKAAPAVVERLSLPAVPGSYVVRASARSGTVIASEKVGIEVRNR
jgi:VWFA-related protein